MMNSSFIRLLARLVLLAVVLLAGPARADLWSECTGLLERGNQAYRAQDIPKAIGYLERAAQIAEQAFGPGHPNVSVVYNSLSTAYMAAGRYNDAEPYLQKAVQIRERAVGSNSPDLVPPLANLAQIYDNQGRYGFAEAYYSRVLSIQQTSDSANLPGLMITLVNIANLYQHEGRYGDSEQFYLRALDIVEKATGHDSVNVLFVVDNLAALYGNQGRYDDAIRLLQRSLAIKEKAYGATSPAVILVLNTLAEVCSRAGRSDDAENLFKRVLSLNEDHHNVGGIAGSLNNLAAFYREHHRLAEAEALYKRALPLQEKAHGPNNPAVATTLANIGLLYDNQRRFAEAEPLFKRALAIDQAAPGTDGELVASDMYALALLYDHLGRAADAEPLFKQALAMHRKVAIYHPADIALTLAGLAAFYDGQGRIDEALANGREAVSTWVHDQGEVNGAFNPEASISGEGREAPRDFLPEFIRILYKAYEKDGSHPQAIVSEAFWASQAVRGLETAQALAGMTTRLASGSDELARLIREQQDLSSRSKALNSSLIKALAQPPSQRSPEAVTKLREEQAGVDAKLKQDDARLKSEFPKFVELARAEPVAVADVQRVLTKDEAFAAITLGEKDSYLFIVRKTSADFFKLDLTRAQAAEAVKTLRAALVDDNPFPDGKSYELYQKLFGPADSLIRDAKHLIVVPDGALQSLPLSILVTADPKSADDYKRVPWLIRRQALTTMPAASSLVSLRTLPAPRSGDTPFTGFGNPEFKGSGKNRGIDTAKLYKGREAVTEQLRNLPSLPDTAVELRAEAKLLGSPESNLHLGSDASVTTVKSLDLSNTRVIAFATHAGVAGEIEGVNEPALVLTPPLHPTAEDDGLLRASQVSQLRLNADFVLLSACNTAASDGTPGAEGLSGLAKAFFYAGARSLLVSHWSVQSGATVKLTTGLIGALAKDRSIGRAEALRRSMLAMLDNPERQSDSHPSAWAPFVLAGEGGAGR